MMRRIDRPRILPSLFLGILWMLLFTPSIFAQSRYLEYIGSSEVELMVFLDVEPGFDGASRGGQEFTVMKEGLKATFTVQRGRVTDVHIHQVFESEDAAGIAFEQAVNFLRRHGLEMNDLHHQDEQKHITGEGNGYHSTVVLQPVGTGHRLLASMSTVQVAR